MVYRSLRTFIRVQQNNKNTTSNKEISNRSTMVIDEDLFDETEDDGPWE
jgi:hypothetical protein